MENQLLEKVTRLEESTKTAHHRIDGIEKKLDFLIQEKEKDTELIVAVKELAVEMKNIREDIVKIDGRVQTIESKPAKNWNEAVTTAIRTIVTAVVGAIIALAIKK